MSDDDSIGLGALLFVPPVVVGLVALINFGPIDLFRNGYNFGIGDTPVIKRELLNYARDGVHRKYIGASNEKVDSMLANELNYYDSLPIDPQKVAADKLWDLSEEYSPDGFQRFFWPKL